MLCKELTTCLLRILMWWQCFASLPCFEVFGCKVGQDMSKASTPKGQTGQFSGAGISRSDLICMQISPNGC